MSTSILPSSRTSLAGSAPLASRRDTAAVWALAVGPEFGKGLLIRRQPIVALLAATSLERSSVTLLQRLRSKYRGAPLMLRVPLHRQAVLLSADHVRTVLRDTPEPFETDTAEKHAALIHFQPRGVLISRGAERASRRALN